jgi:hypothetical protein
MAGAEIIQVQLPEGAEATRGEVELLKGIFEAIVALRDRQGQAGDEIEAALTAEGWSVHTHLKWVAEARKGSELEEVTGATRAEALKHLHQLVKADQVLSAP